jgi:hypothetical protein
LATTQTAETLAARADRGRDAELTWPGVGSPTTGPALRAPAHIGRMPLTRRSDAAQLTRGKSGGAWRSRRSTLAGARGGAAPDKCVEQIDIGSRDVRAAAKIGAGRALDRSTSRREWGPDRTLARR